MKSPERKAKDAANARAWRAANRERARATDRACKERNAEAIKATKKRCYEKHREQNLAYAAAYREANATQIKQNAEGKYSEWSARYYAKHKEKCLEMTRAWKEANPDRRKAANADWSKRNLHKHRTYQHNRRARKGGEKLSPDLAKKLYLLQRGLCACCGQKLGDDYEMDHIVPLIRGGSNTDENIQLLTATCNRRKGPKDPIQYMQAKGKLL